MSDLMAMDTERATELRQRMETAADDLDWDAQALESPLAEAASLLGSPLPDIGGGARRVAGELRDSALDLQERTRMVLSGGPEMNEGLGALERIREHFTMIESRGTPDEADGLLSRRDLRWAVHSADSVTAAAAGWLLDHDLFFDQVETAKHNDDYFNRVAAGDFPFDPNDRDGLMSRDDIDAFLDKTAARWALMPHAATIDAAGDARADGFTSRADFEAFLGDYNLTAEEASAVRQVLDDRAYHTTGDGIGLGGVLDAVSFVPVVGDVIDGARSIYYTLHGDFGTASLFALGLVPLPGLSSSGLRGAKKLVDMVMAAARAGGMTAGSRMAARLVMKGTAANYAAHEGAKQASGVLDPNLDIDESVDYVVDDVLNPQIEDLLEEDLDPVLRRLLTDRLEQSLNDRLDLDARVHLSEANTVIARRIAEHHAFEAIFRRVSPG
ncbi:MAG: hypothetical protein F4Y99_04415 [Acidimicrobiaceae bacterium]|nr:hypothetical protein [Acidimicrobiaceae bacterium]MXZ95154.1 hypothetical protein [Acidimicrobiaceae bacterium]MYF43850.1 hypothetical protein [Acidimicrobiaceae bacterium]